MVANIADDVGSPSDVIDRRTVTFQLKGSRPRRLMLARAHANERPHRKRNLAYFESLPAPVLERREIALPQASVLIDVGFPAEALPILRRLRSEMGEDAFVLLLYAEAMRRSRDDRGVIRLLQALDLEKLTGDARHRMGVIQLAAAQQGSAPAYKAAYDLVRANPDNPDIALGYLGLGLLLLSENPSFSADAVEVGACVTIEANDQTKTFVIDEGPAFFGRELRLRTRASQSC